MNTTTSKHVFYSLIAAIILLSSCKNQSCLSPREVLDFASLQTKLMCDKADKEHRIPRTIEEDGEMHWTNPVFDWTEGFFPGTCWFLYEYTKNKEWEAKAMKYQNMFKEHRYLTTNHDLGFVFNCSFGNAYRLTKDEAYKTVLVDAANSLITRFNPTVGCIQSWNVDKGWQAKRDWKYPVIIDNMMNLELLFVVSDLTGDPIYKEIAISHANTTMVNHFRDDSSSYHVVDYDPATGEVRHKHTAQGYAHESSWARGQAWGLYGFTVCYRYTKNKSYLEMADRIASFILNNPNLPKDLIPYWDFNAPQIPKEPRDVSASTVIASALLELDQYSSRDYATIATTIINNLSTERYLAKLGENNHFVLKHSVGSIPHGAEIDVPLNYADYYYLEALLRLKKATISMN